MMLLTIHTLMQKSYERVQTPQSKSRAATGASGGYDTAVTMAAEIARIRVAIFMLMNC